METTIIFKIHPPHLIFFFCLYSAYVIHVLPLWLHRLNALMICINKHLMYTYTIPYRGDLHSQRSWLSYRTKGGYRHPGELQYHSRNISAYHCVSLAWTSLMYSINLWSWPKQACPTIDL